MTTMRAAVLYGDGRIELHDAPVPRPGPREICVRLEGSGVCASNLPVWTGQPWFRYPLEPGAPGHEGWGEIVAIGDDVAGHAVGDRVATLSGRAYAEYDIAPADGAVRIPDTLRGEPLPGEPLACAMNIVRRSDIRRGDDVAIVGVGYIGALVIQLAAAAGARVTALSRRAFSLDVARECGAHATLATIDAQRAIGAAIEATSGRGYARVVEAAGEQSTLDIASALVAEGGRLVIAGYHQNGPRTVDMQQWNWRGIDVVNAHERDPAVQARGLREAIDAVAAGRLRPLPLLTHRFPLADIGRAFEMLAARPDGFVKAAVLA